ncbi:MAG TPA: RagB/SusD family nutrient uptake outer membrane protein, partial [Gemmatimonadales bacterium]|nr:RagB/SusD family nutrient uptake outer membrane protein [Gemmatimonadales bacterium]
MRAHLYRSVSTVALLVLGACSFDIVNTNNPTQDDLINNPTKGKLSAAATGLFSSSRNGIQGLIWRLGSMGREGINLTGNNQPDYQEPFYGPVQAGGSFGGTQWGDRYAVIRSANIYLDALKNDKDLTAEEIAASRGFARTIKALQFMYLTETRGFLGAAVEVDRELSAGPAPWVTEDQVWGYIVAQLDSGLADLAAAGDTTPFPFPIPPGYTLFADPPSYIQFNRALAAKANVFRATAQNGCGGNPTTCYDAALTALDSSFLNTAVSAFPLGAYYDFSTASGDQTNGLSDGFDSPSFFAMQGNVDSAETQSNGTDLDQRLLNKVMAVPPGDSVVYGGIPEIPGNLKFTIYLTNLEPDAGHPIPIIKDEELILLRAEAEWFTGDKAGALTDIDNIRVNSGGLNPTSLTTGSSDAAFVAELLYNRRYSLLWEQG